MNQQDQMIKQIAESFGLLESVVPNCPKGDLKAQAMRVWLAVLSDDDVTPELLAAAIVRWLKSEKFMPTPSEILRVVRDIRPPFVINDPVKVIDGRGEVRIGSRSVLIEKGIPFIEMADAEPTPRLPDRGVDVGRLLENIVDVAEAKAV